MKNLKFNATSAPLSKRRWFEKRRATVFLFSLGLTTPTFAESDVHVLAAHPSSTALEAALAARADPKQRELSGDLPLMTAVKAQRTESVKALLVLFERPGCTACERFHARVLKDKSIRRLIGQLEAVQLDASDEQGRVVTPNGEKTSPAGWYRDLGLSYDPAILFFDEQGNEVMRLDSETLRYRMEGSLQLVLEHAYEKDAQLQRWRRAKAAESIQRRSGG